jgi:SsrA-binding protein
MSDTPVIKNKRAYFEFEILDTYTAGIMLTGTEIKSVREGKVNLGDGFCFFKKDDLFVRNLHITEYSHGAYANHDPLRQRKLLLTKRELRKIQAKVKERGFTIVPVSMFISERGFAKLEIALARGKKTHDKRESIKARDSKKELDRAMKYKRN